MMLTEKSREQEQCLEEFVEREETIKELEKEFEDVKGKLGHLQVHIIVKRNISPPPPTCSYHAGSSYHPLSLLHCAFVCVSVCVCVPVHVCGCVSVGASVCMSV